MKSPQTLPHIMSTTSSHDHPHVQLILSSKQYNSTITIFHTSQPSRTTYIYRRKTKERQKQKELIAFVFQQLHRHQNQNHNRPECRNQEHGRLLALQNPNTLASQRLQNHSQRY
eukprot:m.67866 g.67866  ORF g.67866 m.67866 type:complete len:114 (-) comp12179_c0_seq1:8568-8909(-)